MSKYRIQRINSQIEQEMAEIIREIKDPRLSDMIISITGAECAKDMKNANIYYSLMNGDPKNTIISEEKLKIAEKAMKNAEGYARSRIAKDLNLRITPQLNFVYDISLIHGAQIERQIRAISEELNGRDEGENDNCQ